MNNPAQLRYGQITERRNRRRWLLGAVAGTAALAGFGIAWRTARPHDSPQTVESGFWLREFETPDDRMIRMHSFRHKPLLLNFWATWCPPCIDELPLLSSFYSEHLANGWQVLGFAIDQKEPVKRFLTRSPVTFPVVMAGVSGVEIGRYLGNSVGGLPFTAVLNSAGQIVQRKMGQISALDLLEWTAQL